MASRILSSLLLAVFVWMVAVPAVAATVGPSSETHASTFHHTEGIPCPDGSDRGPCDDGCSCICCPGHAVMMVLSTAISLETPRIVTVYRIGPPQASHPNGILLRVFRPPRH